MLARLPKLAASLSLSTGTQGWMSCCFSEPVIHSMSCSAKPCSCPAGGRGGPDYASSIPLGDLWTFDLSEGTWQRRMTDCRAPQPLPRWLFSYDVYTTAAERAVSSGNQLNGSAVAALQRGLTRHSDTYLVVFGGETYEGCYLNDLWQLNLDSYQWELLAAAKLDSRRCRSLVSQTDCQRPASDRHDQQLLSARRSALF